MAGDWIKMRTDLRDDPAVIAIAAALGVEEDLVVGKLHRLWSWVDRQTTDGNAQGVTETWIDRYLCVTGFAHELANVGWLDVSEDRIVIPNFERHNGQSAKQRGLTAKRVASHKAKKGNADSVTSALPREEKRREEKKKEEGAAPPAASPSKNTPPEEPIPGALAQPAFLDAWSRWKAHRKEIRKPLTPTATRQQLAELAGWGLARAVAAINHTIARGWQGLREPDQPCRNGHPGAGPAEPKPFVREFTKVPPCKPKPTASQGPTPRPSDSKPSSTPPADATPSAKPTPPSLAESEMPY